MKLAYGRAWLPIVRTLNICFDNWSIKVHQLQFFVCYGKEKVFSDFFILRSLLQIMGLMKITTNLHNLCMQIANVLDRHVIKKSC